MGKRGEADVVELFPVNGAVEVAGCGDGCWEEGSDGVDGLEDAFNVATASDFFDEDWGEAF